ncbi:MAG: RHH-type transcriptional regulator, proline utilization regulon repressor / proline dehydrogenase [Verrucomicrobiota bacterium]|nr:RHH-type transcriptional regulator, proline utilization regulon repressor / proline dehydrogenase [Verrucomicrobiota bacterium]
MSDFLPPDPVLEAAIKAKGERLFTLMDQQPPPALFSKKGAYARLMEWSMKDPAFKTQLFRFVDVLPTLKSSGEIVRHLQEYLGDKAVELNPALKAGLAASSYAPALVATPVKAQIVDMANQFVAGESGEDLIRQLRRNTKLGLATTIDLLGETVVSDAEADVFLQRNLEVLDSVSKFLAKEPTPAFSDLGPKGPLPRLNLSVKISALTPDVHPADPENSIVALKERFRPILRRAAQVGALVNFDMESYKLKDLTLALFKSIFEEPEFRQQPAIGIAIQAYLRDCESDLRDLVAWARKNNRPLSIRLVKGAYWDYETIVAQQRDWPVPVWSRKSESDANYEKLTRFLLENIDLVTPNFASHNVRSCAHAIAQAERLGIDPRAYEFQALYGMADELKLSLLQMGHRVREYCAIGELLPGMAYLVRRLLENTSNEGFLRLKNMGEATKDALLANPVTQIAAAPAPLSRKTPAPGSFVNAANTDFSKAELRDKQRAALNAVAGVADPGRPGSASPATKIRLGQKYPLIISGKKITDREYVASVNPAKPSQVIGHWARATVADADAAVASAHAAFPKWRATPVEDRAKFLERAADLMESRRHELNALLILEAGKPWLEADGDTSEAIDFCRFYAVEMRKLAKPVVTQAVPGERCVQTWTPRGVGVAIAPWNFPLAILTGLVVAPLVAGNCVIMKPAEQTSVIGATLMEILIEAGLPAGVVNFLPGFGEDIGAHLTGHKDVDFIAFTGSRAVGCAIWESAGRTKPGQANLKKVVCEMGGKNALIIDNDADLDEAIPAALYSAFGFSGQKCSALSRLIVLDEVYDAFVERFLSACPAIPVGSPTLPGTVVGPVIDADAQKKILGLIEQGKKEAKLAFQGQAPAEGYFIPPTVFTNVKPTHAIAREEIFGPVVAILRAKDLDEAFALVNGTDYALTGGLFSRSPRALERAQQELLVGNLYLNRAITGAIVERHPFGGFKMSGGGTKAGGKGYLENFLFPRSVAENVMRRGFTPPEE